MAELGTGYTGEEAIEEYISTHIEPEGKILSELYRATNLRLLNPRMASGHIQGRILKMLTGMIRPSAVLEIGTFTGYSAICIAEGVQEGGVVHTVECNDEQEDFIRSWIGRSGYGDRIKLHIGDALKVVPEMGLVFDMVFIDGEKREYPDYLTMVLDYVRPGGYIIADNTLWDGHVADSAYDRDAQTIAIRAFNDMAAATGCLETVMIPVRDGLTVMRKK
ncbi:MAG: O-methyltransferase [Bacteroidaceae bacterium]|nr:O-methyltransferase [Bacteroidaceae bacterium]